MTNKESRSVKTLSGFMKWTEQFDDGQYLFRGVSNQNYEIVASASRRIGEDNSNPAKLLQINEEMISDARLEGHDLKDGHQLTDLELLAELQHYGAATCLIDFTYSAQVALWMACRQSSKWNVNGKVFAVRSNDPVRFKKITPKLLRKNLEHFFKADKHRGYPLYQWQPKQQNNRIIAQQSIFLFGGAKIEAEAECIILKSGKEVILTSLEKSSGITEARMFPDFAGFAHLRAHNRKYIEPNVQNYLRRGNEAHQEGKLDEAIEYYDVVISSNPPTPMLVQTYHNRALAYSSKRKYDKAIGDYRKVLEFETNHTELARACYNMGLVYTSKGEVNNAITNYKKAIEFNQNYAWAYNNLGNVYRDTDKFKEAIKNYDKAIELDHFQSYYSRSIVWLRLKNWEKARKDLTDAQNAGMDIVTSFEKDCESIAGFKEKFDFEFPDYIAAILTY